MDLVKEADFWKMDFCGSTIGRAATQPTFSGHVRFARGPLSVTNGPLSAASGPFSFQRTFSTITYGPIHDARGPI